MNARTHRSAIGRARNSTRETVASNAFARVTIEDVRREESSFVPLPRATFDPVPISYLVPSWYATNICIPMVGRSRENFPERNNYFPRRATIAMELDVDRSTKRRRKQPVSLTIEKTRIDIEGNFDRGSRTRFSFFFFFFFFLFIFAPFTLHGTFVVGYAIVVHGEHSCY